MAFVLVAVAVYVFMFTVQCSRAGSIPGKWPLGGIERASRPGYFAGMIAVYRVLSVALAVWGGFELVKFFKALN
jgi:type IV secretory pathway VirB2 component (pilin)